MTYIIEAIVTFFLFINTLKLYNHYKGYMRYKNGKEIMGKVAACKKGVEYKKINYTIYTIDILVNDTEKYTVYDTIPYKKDDEVKVCYSVDAGNNKNVELLKYAKKRKKNLVIRPIVEIVLIGILVFLFFM